MRTLGRPQPFRVHGRVIGLLVTATAWCALAALAGTGPASGVGADAARAEDGGLSMGYRAGYEAVVGNKTTCGPTIDQPCPSTEIHIRTPQDWDNPDTQEHPTFKLVDLATGTTVSTSNPVFLTGPIAASIGAHLDPGYDRNFIAVETTSLLPAGAYRIDASLEYPAHTTCAINNHPQCISMPKLGWTGEWRFRYDGVTKLIQPMFQPATATLTHKITRKGSYVVSRGRVWTAIVDPVTFLLGEGRGTAGARVKVFTLRAQRWVHRKTVTTRSDGTYRARVRQRTRTLIKLLIQDTPAYPRAGFATSYKR